MTHLRPPNRWLGLSVPVRRRDILSLLTLFAAPFASANEALDRLERGGRSPTSSATTPTEAPAPSTARTWQPPAWSASSLDPVWNRATLYENPENPWIQSVAITGQFDWRIASGSAEIDAANGQPEQRIGIHGSLTRRARLGARIRAFNNTDIEAAGEFAGNSSYSGIERLAIHTTAIPHVTLRAGKFRPPFSNDFIDDPQHSPYPDRNVLTHMLVPNRALGLTLGHSRGDWDYALGWFSNDTDPWFPSLDSSGLIIASVRRHFLETTGSTPVKGVWNLDYMFNLDDNSTHLLPRPSNGTSLSANGGQPITDPAFRHMVNAGVTLESQRTSLNAGFSFATGDSKVWGVNISPTWWAIPGTLRIVGRYQYAASNTAGGVITALGPASDPLRNPGTLFTGNTLHSFYLGANLHLYQDKLLLTTGLENTLIDDADGLGFNTEAWILHAGAHLSF
jgi:hypothetical protein